MQNRATSTTRPTPLPAGAERTNRTSETIRSVIATTIIGSLAASLMACTPQAKMDDVKRIDTGSILADASLSRSDKAEQLALAGEQLMTPTSFMYADLIFDQALSIDSSNFRAQFYKSFLATPMALRGILARIKPIVDTSQQTKTDYDKLLQDIPNHALKNFLLDGKADIATERDIQNFLAQIYDGQDEFRNFLKNNKSRELTLNMNDWTAIPALQKANEECRASIVEPGVYELKACNKGQALQVKLNRVDFEALQQIAAGWQIYLGMLISYDATGISATSKVVQARRDAGHDVSTREVYRELMKHADFGKLINPKALTNIVTLGMDAVAGIRWAVQIERQLCADSEGTPKARPGFMFSTGLCVLATDNEGAPVERTLRVVEAVLSGQTLPYTFLADEGRKQSLTTEIKPIAPLANPIADLKSLRPAFNACNMIVSVSDDTVGGLFPNRDANDVLALTSNCISQLPPPAAQRWQ